MTEFYTVVMNRKVTRTTYDGDDKLVDEAFVEERYYDLPHSTAMAYQTKFPEAFVAMVPQIREFNSKNKASVVVINGFNAQKNGKNVRSISRPAVHDKLERNGHAINEAKTRATGQESYADVINKMMGS